MSKGQRYQEVHLHELMEVVGEGWQERKVGFERVFTKPHPHDDRVTIWLYSSISVGHTVSRAVAKDAIRITLTAKLKVTDYDKPVLKEGRTNRVPGWELRLKTKLDDLLKVKEPIKDCDRCGGFMVIRKAKRGPNKGKAFLGCSNYPDCHNTSNEV